MNLPFLRFFKKYKAKAESNVAIAPNPIVAIEKPASERLGRTFLPNVARTNEPESEPEFSLPVPMTGASSGAAVIAPPQISREVRMTSAVTAATAVLPETAPPQNTPGLASKVSLETRPALRVSGPNESTAEKSERTIALPLVDLVERIPAEMLRTVEIDPEHHILFKATAIERGMASGRPSVPLHSIYQQAPEFFTREVSPEDSAQVDLPVMKVLEQFSTFRVRSDQLHDPDIPQMETPILKVTLEDSERFGTPAKTVAPPKPVTDAKVEFPAVTSVASPLATPPASSPTASDPVASGAVPASVVPKPATPAIPELKTVKPIRLSVPSQETPAAASSTQPAPSITSSAAPAPRPVIKAKFSPNGIGGPASERVPASSGPPVPTPLPSPFAPLPPTRIAFKVAPPSDDLRSPLAPTSEIAPLTPAVAAPKLPELTPNGPRLQLPLRVVLQGIAPVQISGPRGEVPESAQIDVPFSIVEPQLSLGRISLSPAQFAAALPAEFRDRFKIEDPHTPIPLPLHEVLQHLPNDTLRVRTDQEAPEIAPAFDTPFSQKAAEDAARFESSKPRENLRQEASDPAKDLAPSETPKPKTISADEVAKPAAPAPATKPISAKPAVKLIPEKTLLPGTSVAAKEPGNAGATTQAAVRTSLQAIFETDETLEPKAIVSQICLFPGVRACAIMFSDGLCLAHNYPPEFTVDTLCAIAPTVVQKIATQISAAHLGALTSLTLFCAKESVSFFAREAICLAALHTGAEEMAVETRARLSATVEELARLYGTQPHTGQPNA